MRHTAGLQWACCVKGCHSAVQSQHGWTLMFVFWSFKLIIIELNIASWSTSSQGACVRQIKRTFLRLMVTSFREKLFAIWNYIQRHFLAALSVKKETEWMHRVWLVPIPLDSFGRWGIDPSSCQEAFYCLFPRVFIKHHVGHAWKNQTKQKHGLKKSKYSNQNWMRL